MGMLSVFSSVASLEEEQEEEQEEEPVPCTSGKDRAVSLGVVGDTDQGVEASSSMEQLQPEQLDGQPAELKHWESQLQQVGMEDPGRELEQLPAISEDEELESITHPKPRLCRAER